MMRKATWLAGAVVAVAILSQSQAEGSAITFYSGDGDDLVNGGAAVIITAHPLWGDVSAPAGLTGGTAEWISYANTGIGGIIAPNATTRHMGDQTALITRGFDLSEVSDFSLWVLADDTGDVRLLGPGGSVHTLFSAFTGQLDPCAPGGSGAGLGCVQADLGVATLTNLAAGIYSLEIYAYQTNGSVFGAQYAGSINSVPGTSPVPEPTSMVLLGSGIAGLVAMRKRKRLQAPGIG